MNRNSTARLVIPVLNLILQILPYESSFMSHTEDMVDPLLPLFPSEQTENLSMSICDTIKFSFNPFFQFMLVQISSSVWHYRKNKKLKI